jgi:DNA-directed RNA polymerase specialized sigma24 family protein
MNAEAVKETLCGGKEERLNELIRLVAATIKKKFKEFDGILEFEELVSETALILLEKKEELCRRQKVNFSFLVKVVRNRLIDKYTRKKQLLTESLFEGEEEDERALEQKLEGAPFNPIVLLNAREALERLKEELSDREFEILCHKVHSALYKKEENPYLKGKSRAAKDKAWSRLRPRVEKLLKEFDLELEEMDILKELIMSECERRFR